jgi:hypothetical protein
MDSALMKHFVINERVRIRANVDVFNRQGLVTPASDGISTLGSSHGGFQFRPRQLQFTMRLEF